MCTSPGWQQQACLQAVALATRADPTTWAAVVLAAAPHAEALARRLLQCSPLLPLLLHLLLATIQESVRQSCSLQAGSEPRLATATASRLLHRHPQPRASWCPRPLCSEAEQLAEWDGTRCLQHQISLQDGYSCQAVTAARVVLEARTHSSQALWIEVDLVASQAMEASQAWTIAVVSRWVIPAQ